MKTFQLGLYEKSMPESMSIPQKLALAKQSGFDYLEMSIDETDQKLARIESLKSERVSLRRTIEELEFPIKSICLSAQRKYPLGSLDDKTIQRSLQILGDAIHFACDIGVTIIQIPGYDRYYEPSTPETAESFSVNIIKAAELAALSGITLGFETMENEFMNTVGKALSYVKLANSPYLQIYPDTGNITNAAVAYGNNVADDIALGKGHIIAAHLKETSPGIYREIPYGTGHTDHSLAIKAYMEQGVRLFVGEFWYDGVSDPLVYLETNRDFLMRQFEKAGVL